MPLPNLRERSLINASHRTSTSTSGDSFQTGAPSYREIIRDKILNTPRQNGQEHHARRSIDLTINRENMYRSSSRLSHPSQSYRDQSDENGLENALEWATKNSAGVSSRRRQVVFYNKTYVPSDEDGIQRENETIIQNDENEETSTSSSRNRVNNEKKQHSSHVNNRFKTKNVDNSFEQNENNDYENHKSFENSRPNSIETNYNIEDNTDSENIEQTQESESLNNKNKRNSSTHLTRRNILGGGSLRENRRGPNPELNSSSSLDISNRNLNESNSFKSVTQKKASPIVVRRNNIVITPRSNQKNLNSHHDLKSPSSSDFNSFNNSFNFENDSDNFTNTRNNSRMLEAPAIAKRNFKNSSYNPNRKSINLDNFSHEKDFDTRSSNEFNLRSSSRTSFRDEDENGGNIDVRNKSYPIPTPRKRLENVTQPKSNLVLDHNISNKDFRIRRSTQSGNRGAISTRDSTYTSKNNNIDQESEDIAESPPSIKYQRQKSAISKKTELFESRNSGRLSSLNYYPSNSSDNNYKKSAKLNSNESNSFSRNSSRNNFFD